MKALLYKEFRLAMHPICYLFIFLFPFMVLIPSYPLAIGFIYVLTCYPILFLGANKGQQSNDLLYSTLLPVRKKDIVLARIFTVALMQLVFILVMSALVPVARILASNITSRSGDALDNPGLGLNGYVSVLAIAIIGFSIADLIFFPIYYRKGRSIVLSTLLMILGFIFYLAIFTILIPYLPGIGAPYKAFLENENIGIQFAILGGALLIYIGFHYLLYRISSRLLERVDF